MSLASSTRTTFTRWPLISMPRISCALACASSGPSASLTPPALPRPPVFTWAFTTTRDIPAAVNFSAIARASSGVRAMLPCGTGTPYSLNNSFAWYSNRSTDIRPRSGWIPQEAYPFALSPRAPAAPAKPHVIMEIWPFRGAVSAGLYLHDHQQGRLGGVGVAEGGLNPADDFVGGGARCEDLGHAHPFQFGDVGIGDDAAAEHGDVRGVAFGEQFEYPAELGHVRAGQDRQPDRVGVFLECGCHDLLRGLVQPGVDHLYSGVTKRPRHDLGAPVVPVQARLGDDDPDRSHDFLPPELRDRTATTRNVPMLRR